MCDTKGTGGPMANSVYKFGKSLGLSIFTTPILKYKQSANDK